MKKLLNFVHSYIIFMVIVFFSTVAYGMEIETKDYSQKMIDSYSKPLEKMSESQKEDLYKSAACEMYWIKVQLSCDSETMEDAFWRIRRESPVSLSGGQPFIEFLRKCKKDSLSSNANLSPISKEEAEFFIAQCCTEEECSTSEEKERFIIKCCNIINGLRYYLQSHKNFQ